MRFSRARLRACLKILLGLGALGAVVACLAILSIGSQLTRPVHVSIGPPPPELSAKPVAFRSPSGSTLQGWFSRGRPGAGAVLLMHGVHSNRLEMLDRARFLHRTGYSVLLFDFQAHGESSGAHITFGWLEARDARAAAAFLRTEAPGEPLAAIGVSLGGAAALLGPQPLCVDALVLESVYPTIEDAVGDRLRIRLGGLGPLLAPLLLLQLRPRLGVSPRELRPVERIGLLSLPVFIMAGTADRHTTIREARALFARAHEPKQFWAVAGAAHVDLQSFAPKQYETRVLDFLSRYLQREPERPGELGGSAKANSQGADDRGGMEQPP